MLSDWPRGEQLEGVRPGSTQFRYERFLRLGDMHAWLWEEWKGSEIVAAHVFLLSRYLNVVDRLSIQCDLESCYGLLCALGRGMVLIGKYWLTSNGLVRTHPKLVTAIQFSEGQRYVPAPVLRTEDGGMRIALPDGRIVDESGGVLNRISLPLIEEASGWGMYGWSSGGMGLPPQTPAGQSS